MKRRPFQVPDSRATGARPAKLATALESICPSSGIRESRPASDRTHSRNRSQHFGFARQRRIGFQQLAELAVQGPDLALNLSQPLANAASPSGGARGGSGCEPPSDPSPARPAPRSVPPTGAAWARTRPHAATGAPPPSGPGSGHPPRRLGLLAQRLREPPRPHRVDPSQRQPSGQSFSIGCQGPVDSYTTHRTFRSSGPGPGTLGFDRPEGHSCTSKCAEMSTPTVFEVPASFLPPEP